MSFPAELAIVYCSDEYICSLIPGDFAALVPKDQVVAYGTDGVFSSGDLWTLSSATVNFQNQGVKVGHVVQLIGPPATFSGSGTKLAVGAVSGSTVTLRRIARPDTIGQPPSPIGGLTGVSFKVVTFDPQIEDVCYEINNKFGIDPNFMLSAPPQIYDLRQLQRAAAITVIVRAYRTDTRSKDGDFSLKLYRFENELSNALGLVQVRWNQLNLNPPTNNRFNTRLSR